MISVFDVFPLGTNEYSSYIHIHQMAVRTALYILNKKGYTLTFVFRKAMPGETSDDFILSMLHFHASP